jgi:hypothetical protein
MRFKTTLLVLSIGLWLALGCSTTPEVRVWQPWTKVSGEVNTIGDIQVSVDYESNPFPGSNVLKESNVESVLEELLLRRGYNVSNDPTTSMRLLASLHTTRRDHLQTGYQYRPRYSAKYLQGSVIATHSVGVTIATIISSLDIKRGPQALTDIHTREGYTHTLGIMISDGNNILWKGESTWDSVDPDIQSHFIPSVQLLFSSLPANPEVLPKVREVNPDKGFDFFLLNCWNRWFSCPALPYRIVFTRPTQGGAVSNRASSPFITTSDIQNEEAFAAYVDLLNTSEFALPKGNSKYNYPLDDVLWKKVQLGGVYDIEGKGITKILIDLEGYSGGYEVRKCRIPSSEEWTEYVEKKAEWESALGELFSFWEEGT